MAWGRWGALAGGFRFFCFYYRVCMFFVRSFLGFFFLSGFYLVCIVRFGFVLCACLGIGFFDFVDGIC